MAKAKKRLKIVCLGGGNLMPKVLLEPLKKYPVELTGITSMMDSGGASGQLREHFNVLPPGDIRRHVLALSNAPQWKKQLWTFRFGNETFGHGHKGHVLSNAFIACLEYNLKSHRKAMAIVSEFMELGKNRALPMITDKTQIFAEMEDGQILEGEREIELSENHDANLNIKKIFQKKETKLFPESKKAILEADLITIGPGDLYSSIIPCFLAKDAPAVFRRAKGKKILISNTVVRKGETHGFSIKKFAAEVEKYMGSELDCVLYHSRPINKTMLANYRKNHPEIGEELTIEKNLTKDKFIGRDILKKNEFAYDSKKVIKAIFKLVKLA
jgi:uncharacterized cofD-like protein